MRKRSCTAREKTLEEVEKWIEKSAQDQDVIDGRNSREADDCKAAENFASFGTDSVLPVSKVSTHTTSTPVSQSTACVQTTHWMVLWHRYTLPPQHQYPGTLPHSTLHT